MGAVRAECPGKGRRVALLGACGVRPLSFLVICVSLVVVHTRIDRVFTVRVRVCVRVCVRARVRMGGMHACVCVGVDVARRTSTNSSATQSSTDALHGREMMPTVRSGGSG